MRSLRAYSSSTKHPSINTCPRSPLPQTKSASPRKEASKKYFLDNTSQFGFAAFLTLDPIQAIMLAISYFIHYFVVDLNYFKIETIMKLYYAKVKAIKLQS